MAKQIDKAEVAKLVEAGGKAKSVNAHAHAVHGKLGIDEFSPTAVRAAVTEALETLGWRQSPAKLSAAMQGELGTGFAHLADYDTCEAKVAALATKHGVDAKVARAAIRKHAKAAERDLPAKPAGSGKGGSSGLQKHASDLLVANAVAYFDKPEGREAFLAECEKYAASADMAPEKARKHWGPTFDKRRAIAVAYHAAKTAK